MATLKIEGARFLVTVDPERRIIRDGTIVIDGQRIVQIGKAAALQDVVADRVIDARDMVGTPGFINNHMHISYAHATRGIFPDNLDPMVYLANVFTLQGAMTEADEYITTLLGITELLKYGTTCFLDPGSTKYLDACLQAYAESGCRIVVGEHMTDQPNPLRLPVYSLDEAVRRMEHTIQRYNHCLDDRVRAWAMPFDAAFCSDALLQAAKGLADQYHTGLTLHQSNRPATVQMYRESYGKRPVEYLEDLGVLGPNVLLSHVIDLDNREIAAIARTDTKTVMCPTAALKMGSRMTATAQLPEMVAQGICVSLGTDAGNNSNLLETLRAMYLVAVLYKDARGTTDVVPAELALELATLQGARALGLEQDIGSLEVGKKADIVLFDTRRPEWCTLFNPINTLVYNADGRSVHTVIVDGRVVIENHRPCYVDEQSLIHQLQACGEALLTRTGIHFSPRWPVV
ncbi:MAG: amidohydrolase family protein [Candidatus Tectomicrobia bacterium]|uniref:Amidohydrolase family protein n=1 Tax=Tectimicrobiota bacterium TaxID=2528274 RepID=A0A937W0U0_UNCTE|nr:amidohydrolase family protein [Candidatus Tectomicrobia bacterium]